MTEGGEHVVVLHNDAVHDMVFVRQALETAAAVSGEQVSPPFHLAAPSWLAGSALTCPGTGGGADDGGAHARVRDREHRQPGALPPRRGAPRLRRPRRQRQPGLPSRSLARELRAIAHERTCACVRVRVWLSGQEGWLSQEQRAAALIVLLRRLCAASNALRALVSAALRAPLSQPISGTVISQGEPDEVSLTSLSLSLPSPALT